MKSVWRIMVLTLLLSSAVAAIARGATEQRVLFIGNSLTYVNSLPAIFELTAQAQASAPRYRADMYVRGGARLSELAQEPQLNQLLTSGIYQIVVLQERGGDVLCAQETGGKVDDTRETCDRMTTAHLKLARLAREHGARVLYMGTYQSVPRFSQMLVRAEAQLGDEMGVPALEISETLRSLQQQYADYPWLYADNSHPGIATTTLMALRVYQALHPGHPLKPYALCTASKLYTNHLGERTFVTHDALTAKAGPAHCLLNEAQTGAIIEALAPSG
ncbi:SGNH/GDSL hydrolase family protein [Dyella sp. EPa41]|uniref:SGNH/GDSL hydrolase family protein n=1 Tax=Dyella sp. EPa41 TaxID=1561194 RepID=UPI001916C6CB|nr:SGNH/GDSL hydrolase family protein [Dyella sp. EPa41]